MTPERLATVAGWLKVAERVAVLTGAGVSAESGVPTFRDANGLWEGHAIEEVATPEAFRRQPELVWRFYNQRRANVRTVAPNPGHRALAALERRYPAGQFTLITQNVDGLHRVAGSVNVLEVHGALSRTRCTGCGRVAERGSEELPDLPRCPSCGHLERPDIVWFRETLPEDVWGTAMVAAATCDVFLTVGTSAVVYPAAGLVEVAQRRGAKVVEVNPQETDASGSADVCLRGPSGVVLPELLEAMTV